MRRERDSEREGRNRELGERDSEREGGNRE